MMDGPSSVLIALGLVGSQALLTGHGTRIGRVGLALALVGLLVPGFATLAVLAPVPPILAPLLGAGLIVLALRGRAYPLPPRFARLILAGLALLQFFAFLWAALVRPETADRIDGYRIYGIGATVLAGLGWIALGAGLAARGRTAGSAPARARPATQPAAMR